MVESNVFIVLLLMVVVTSSASDAPLSFGPSFEPSSQYGGSARFGYQARNVGDLNADNLEDFAFGANLADGSFFCSGAVFVVWGTLDSFVPSFSSSSPPPITLFPNASIGLIITASARNIEFGTYVNGGCDLNGDGVDDLIIGSHPQWGGLTTSIVFGRRSTDWPSSLSVSQLNGFTIIAVGGEEWTLHFGSQVACVGDFDGDKFNDLLFGDDWADWNSGRTVLIYGRASWPATLTLSISATFGGIVFVSETRANYLGSSLGSLDLNIDGQPDLVISANGANSSSGQVNVIWGGTGFVPTAAQVTAITTVSTLALPVKSTDHGCFFTGASLSQLGSAVTTTGDINGDGHNDLVISADSLLQKVFVVFAANTAWSLGMNISRLPNLVAITRDQSSGIRFGVSLATGDLNGDEVDDIVIGAPASFTGLVFVVFDSNSMAATINATGDCTTDVSKWTCFSVTPSRSIVSVGVVHGPHDIIVVGVPYMDSGKGYLVSGPTCVVLNGEGNCSKCVAGFGLSDGNCTACLAGQMFSDGTTPCKQTATATSCTSHTQAGTFNRCSRAGTMLKWGECFECSGNTWSNGTMACIAGPDNCININHETGMCSACTAGCGFNTANNHCTTCSGNTWSNGITTCQAGPQHCKVCSHITGACSECDSAAYLLDKNINVCTLRTWTGENKTMEIKFNVDVSQLAQLIATQLQISEQLVQVLSVDGLTAKVAIPATVVNTFTTMVANNQLPGITSATVITMETAAATACLISFIFLFLSPLFAFCL